MEEGSTYTYCLVSRWDKVRTKDTIFLVSILVRIISLLPFNRIPIVNLVLRILIHLFIFLVSILVSITSFPLSNVTFYY